MNAHDRRELWVQQMQAYRARKDKAERDTKIALLIVFSVLAVVVVALAILW